MDHHTVAVISISGTCLDVLSGILQVSSRTDGGIPSSTPLPVSSLAQAESRHPACVPLLVHRPIFGTGGTGSASGPWWSGRCSPWSVAFPPGPPSRVAPRRSAPSSVSGRRRRAEALASVRRPNCTYGFPVCSFHEDTARRRELGVKTKWTHGASVRLVGATSILGR